MGEEKEGREKDVGCAGTLITTHEPKYMIIKHIWSRVQDTLVFKPVIFNPRIPSRRVYYI